MIIDPREGSKELHNFPPISSYSMLSTLEHGDVLMCGNGPKGDVAISVEFKSIKDLVSSLRVGRLQDQLIGMLTNYDVSYLLYYGMYMFDKEGRLQLLKKVKGKYVWRIYKINNKALSYRYIESFLHTARAVGVKVAHLPYERKHAYPAAAEWLDILYKWWQKPFDGHESMKCFNVSNESGWGAHLLPGIPQDIEVRARMIKQLPTSIGYKRSLAIAQKFTSIQDMMSASVEELQSIDGIGPVIARNIVEILSTW